MGRWGRRWLTRPGRPRPGPVGSRRVGGRDVPTTWRVWPRGTVGCTSRDAYHDRRGLDDRGLADAKRALSTRRQDLSPRAD
jgi:hypothetical protein